MGTLHLNNVRLRYYDYTMFRGKVVSGAEEKETIIYGDVDLDHLEQVRTSIPTSKQKRHEVYKSATSLI